MPFVIYANATRPLTEQKGGMEMEEKQKKLEELGKRIDQNEAYYPSWEPQPEEKLVGEVIARRIAGGNDLIVVRPLGGEPRTVWNSTVLRKLFEQVKIGDLVALKYLGEAASKTSGRTYKNYRFELAR